MDYLGEFEQLVILALLHLDHQAYGVAIRREIPNRARGVRPASVPVHKTRSSAGKGLVSSRIGEPTRERGGRRKQGLQGWTPAGLRAVRRLLQTVTRMTTGLDILRLPGNGSRP